MQKFLPFLLALAMLFLSCRKKPVDTDTQAAEDNAIAEQSFSQAGSTVVAVGIKEEGVKKTSDLFCATVTVTDANGNSIDSTNINSFPKKVEIDFGTNGCTDNDGRLRKGKIRAEYSDRWKNSGAKVTINFVDYYVDDVQIQGIVETTNNGNYSYTTIVDNGKMISPSYTIEFETQQTIKWISGYSTDSIATDDVYEISGNSSGVNRKGESYTSVIVLALKKEMNCKWFVSGQVELVPEGKAKRSINYGDGTCDNKATVTINGNSKEIELP